MIFRQLFDYDTWTYTYLMADEETRQAVIIDPVRNQTDRDERLIRELGLKLRYSFETHVHADHITGAGILRDHLGVTTVVARAAQCDCADEHAVAGDTFDFGRYQVEVRTTPGHTAGCLSYVVRDGKTTRVMTGDALLIRGCGRTDFQQGDARTLYRSVHEQLFTLPDETRVYPGHDYQGRTCTTIGEERVHNPRLGHGIDEDTFVRIMEGLDLPHPRRIHAAVPANMACGLSVC